MSELHLITGVSGFLGARTAKRLLELGHRVVGIDFRELPNEELRKHVDFRQGDIRNVNVVSAAISGVDVVHHQAALVPLTRAYQDFWSVNALGSKTVAEVARW